MPILDILMVFQWWIVIFAIGIIFLPLSNYVFSHFFDRGYIFSKIIGLILISYVVFVLSTLHILPFTNTTIFIVSFGFLVLMLFLFKKGINDLKKYFIVYIVEEILFLAGIFFWAYIRAFNPDIHGLEKYMDFGFVNSILRTTYFPPKDMWYPPYPINYYYFGHLVTAVITKFSGLTSNITFNLMLATIFAFTLTASFSIVGNLLFLLKHKTSALRHAAMVVIGGLTASFLTTFAGNIHSLYTFFKPYPNESPVPPWKLAFSPLTFPNQYWYPNATRFIYHTIHEFPIYSFVVSDLHGHVLDIPFVFLTIAFLFSIFTNSKIISARFLMINSVFIGFLLAVMYMTNAWDGMIYFLLTAGVIFVIEHKRVIAQNHQNVAKNLTIELLPDSAYKHEFKALLEKKPSVDFIVGSLCYLFITGISFLIFSLPFSLFFNTSEIVHGIGILCVGNFFHETTKIGPFLFEPNHCQHSPFWQLAILYGFFYFWVITFLVFIYRKTESKIKSRSRNAIQEPRKGNLWSFVENWSANSRMKLRNLSSSDQFVIILIVLSTVLIIIPEFVYLKDIYPEHYRANTMFKLVYQSFMMLSLASGYIIIRKFTNLSKSIVTFIYLIVAGVFLILVSIYPYFAVNSYYGFQMYKGLDGTKYLQGLYPTDYDAINFLNKNVPGQPIILEAQGDSYTDYARISANTGLVTPLGWTVHEWLWRGSYDPLPERINDIQNLYETDNLSLAENLIKKYNISLVFVGSLEREKYKNLNESKFLQLGKIIYKNGETAIYQVGN